MSADNGIYILQTYGPEYRVKHLQNIDAIYGKFNDDTYRWEGDDEEMFNFFGDCHVFDDLENALDKADELSQNIDFLEYGICVITDFASKKFPVKEG